MIEEKGKLSENQVAEVAAQLLADYDAVQPGAAFANGMRVELADAWRLQTAVTALREARGEKVIGYKVGAVTPGNQQMMGLPHPVWGRLWSSELHTNGVVLQKNAYANLAIEAEFGILLSADVLPDMTIEEVASCVASVFPTLELHNLQLQSDKPHGPELVATNCINCGVVQGAAIRNAMAPCETDLKLIYDGVEVDGWQNLRWPQDLLAALDWLAGALLAQSQRLKAGDLVLTSAWGPPIPVHDTRRVDVTSSAFGDVYATIA